MCSDNWDYLVQTKYCCRNGLTINQFDKPQKFGTDERRSLVPFCLTSISMAVLDMGRGAGLWTIEAAKQWKVSTLTVGTVP